MPSRARLATITISSAGAITAKTTVNAPLGFITITDTGELETKGVMTAGTNVTLKAQGTKGMISEGSSITAGSADTISLTALGTGTYRYHHRCGQWHLRGHGRYNHSINKWCQYRFIVRFQDRQCGALAPNVNVSVTTGGLTGSATITNKDSLIGRRHDLGPAPTNVGSFKLTDTNGVSATTNTGTLNVGAHYGTNGNSICHHYRAIIEHHRCHFHCQWQHHSARPSHQHPHHGQFAHHHNWRQYPWQFCEEYDYDNR